MKKRILSLALGLSLSLGASRGAWAYGNIYEGRNFKLEKIGNAGYVSMNYPLEDGGYTWGNVYKINNVKRILDPIDYKLHFDKGAGISGSDEFPYVELDGPLELESLRENIFLDAAVYERQGRNFKSLDTRFYMDGQAKYLVYDQAGQKQEELSLATGKIREQEAQWKEEGKKYLPAGYERGGRIYSEKGRIAYGGFEKDYSHFLIRGQNWRDQEELPRVFIRFEGAGEDAPINAKFKDVDKKSWYSNYIIKLVEVGGVKGYEDGNFKPNGKISVGEFLKMSLSSVTGQSYEASDGTHWATGVYDFALDQGIIKAGDFPRSREGLNKEINREDMAYIINNIDSKLKNNKDEDLGSISKDIGDFSTIKASRQEGVAQAYKKGLIKGRDGAFDPRGLTTRAEATTVVVRLLDR